MTPEQVQRFRRAAQDPKITFYFMPSQMLRDGLTQGSDPVLSQMAKSVKMAILGCEKGEGMCLDPALVVKFVEGTIDDRNAQWLRMGEIRVVGLGDMIARDIGKNKTKEG